ncbi:GH24377 [Drosophila grimshawi]|uniref:GH24377 n=2 Tax=Drosophila grimshawi TaxID=7222 RepID=B4JM85_DROGR|nr:GH24377 [Drosophila grimshawi]
MEFNCRDEVNMMSYSENLTEPQILQRIRELNKRIHFPIAALNAALSGCNPVEAKMLTGPDAAENDAVLSLKYRVEGAAAPLKWEWHLAAMDSAIFFRNALKVTLNEGYNLNTNLQYLLNIIKLKDKELQQYRIEGSRLLRTTVATERFDADAFRVEHDRLLSNVAKYEDMQHVLDDSMASTTGATIKCESPVDKTKTADVATTIPCDTAVKDASKTMSPRNRKRKAMETGIQHVERKVLQRRRVPQLQYKNTESQEDDLEASLAEIKPDIKTECDEDDDLEDSLT